MIELDRGKTEHPCAGMTRAQVAAFERIALGISAGHHPDTIRVLLAEGLIDQDVDKVVGRDRFGLITVPDYFVPLPLHIRWCNWCAKHVTDEDEKDA